MARTTKLSAPLPDVAARSLRRNFGWALGGRVVYGASQFALLVVLARLGSVSAVGAFAFALAFTAPPVVLANLQLRSLYATDVGHRFSWATYVALRRRATVVAFVAIASSLTLLHGAPEVVYATLWIALAKAFETVSDLHYGVFQRYGRMDRFGRSLAMRGVVGVAIVAVVLALGGSLPWATAAMAAWWGLMLVGYDAPMAARVRPRTDCNEASESISRLLLQAAPMGLVSLLDSLHQNVPRYFVEAQLGTDQLGLFTPMAYMVTIGSAFVFALGAPAAPVLARHAAARDHVSFAGLAHRVILRGAMLGGVGVIVTVFFGEPLLDIAYGPRYAAESAAFVFVAIGGALHFVMVPTVFALTAARVLRVQPVIFALAIAAAAVASALLVGPHGLVGAAIAGAAGMAAGTASALLLLRRTIALLRGPSP
jgi:O-antigen/teichoic acid export membrane protein